MDQEGYIAAVIDDELGAQIFREGDGFEGKLPVFFQRLGFPSEDRSAGSRDGGGGVVLGREDVAARPADIGAEGDESFDEDGRLDGHVEGAGDADACQGFFLAVFFADGHEAGHFVFGDGDFLSSPSCESEVGDDEVRASGSQRGVFFQVRQAGGVGGFVFRHGFCHGFGRCFFGGFFCWFFSGHCKLFLFLVFGIVCGKRVLFRGFFEGIHLVGEFPCDVGVILSEVPVVGALRVDRAEEVQLRNDVCGFEAEHLVDSGDDFVFIGRASAESVHMDAYGDGVADRVGKLHFALRCEACCDDIFCDIAAHVSGGAIDF